MANPKERTPEFRLSFPHVFEPHAFKEGDEPKYRLTMLFPKSTDLSALQKLAKDAVIYKWPDVNKRPKTLRSPFRDGNEVEYEGFKDQIFIAASSKNQPGVVDQSGKRYIVSEEELYAGCYCMATVVAYAYSYMGNSGVAFGLHNIQKRRDGEPFSGKVAAENDFDAVDTGEEITDFANTEAPQPVQPVQATMPQPEPSTTVEQVPNFMM